jgi:hypothetical protein
MILKLYNSNNYKYCLKICYLYLTICMLHQKKQANITMYRKIHYGLRLTQEKSNIIQPNVDIKDNIKL